MPDLTPRSDFIDKAAWLRFHGCNLDRVPPHMRQSVADYILFGVPVGGFLTALFSNDLKGAYLHADDTNTDCMLAWVRFMINDMPALSQGSPETIAEWMESGGVIGRQNEEAA